MSLAMAVSAPPCEFVGTNHSTLTHHGACCDLAKSWLHAMHRSLVFSRTDRQSVQAPGWLRRHYKWGPVQWPLIWCEAVNLKTIDCGVFAAFAREILERAVMSDQEVFPAQIILDQPATYTSQWTGKWEPIVKEVSWIGDRHVYHEVCAVTEPGSYRIRIYDPTEGVWIEPILERGINNVIGVTVRSPRMLNWGTLSVGLDQWQTL